MSNRTIKFIGALQVFLIIFNAWLFINFKIEPALYVSLFSALLLFLIFRLFFIRIKKLEKKNAGIMHILNKSEESRIIAEELKNKVLLMVDDLPEGILIVSKDDKILVINSRAENFLGINRRQVLNKPVLELGHLSNVKKIVFPLLANFKGAHKEEIEVRKNFILDLVIEPLVMGKNNIAKLIILQNTTKMKQAKVSKNQFISIAAHQLKSPLSATKVALKMLLNQDFGKINKEQQDVLEKTYKKNESLIYLVEDLLREEEINESGQLNNKSLVNLEDLIMPAIDFYKDEIKRKKIGFKFNKPDVKLPEVLANQEKIKMVIQNLFDNAVKYTPLRGKIEIDITLGKLGIEFKIKDSGIGIPESQQEKIFTRFYRTSAAKTKLSGSGLGLAIAKDIIEKHHGKIWFQSKENQGSTFFFSLPQAKEQN